MPWEQLKAIIDENRQLAQQARQEPPVACPIDGDVLDIHPDGSRSCPMGNFAWPFARRKGRDA